MRSMRAPLASMAPASALATLPVAPVGSAGANSDCRTVTQMTGVDTSTVE
jgi:hypothetical protein